MGPRSTIAPILVLLLLVSGCTQRTAPPPSPSEVPTSPSTNEPSPDPTAVPIGAPQWSTTTRWTWTLSSQVLAAPLTLTTGVTKDSGAQYQVGIDSQPNFERVYPLHILALGPVRKSDLAWEAHGTPVPLLRFPIRHDETWTTDLWLGTGLSVHVRRANVQEPDGAAEGFLVNVTYPAGAIALQADYSPRLGQFVRIAAYFGANQPFSSAILTRVSEDASDLLTYTGTELLRKNTPGGSQPTAPSPFTVSAGDGFVLVACFMGGAQGAYGASVVAPDATHAECSHTNQPGQSATILQTHSAAAVPGSWTATVPPPAQGFTNLEVFRVTPVP